MTQPLRNQFPICKSLLSAADTMTGDYGINSITFMRSKVRCFDFNNCLLHAVYHIDWDYWHYEAVLQDKRDCKHEESCQDCHLYHCASLPSMACSLGTMKWNTLQLMFVSHPRYSSPLIWHAYITRSSPLLWVFALLQSRFAHTKDINFDPFYNTANFGPPPTVFFIA